ncbi:MAG: tetratricopeptide repeat protein [Chloroflexota bacterium]
MKEQLQTIDELLTRNDVRKAETLIAKLIRSDVDIATRSQLLFRRARLRLLLGRPEDALDDLQNIPGETSKLPATLELLGDIYFARFELASVGFADRNDTLRAQEYYNDIIQNNPRYSNLGWIYYQRGRIWITTDETDRAVECLQRALIAPSHIGFLTAYCYERLGFISFYEDRDLETALAFLNRAVNTYPSYSDKTWLIQVHILRSRVLRGLGDYESALGAAKDALSIVSNHPEKRQNFPEALLSVAELLAELENRDKEVVSALQQFIQSVKKPLGVDVTWSRVNEMLGNAYFNLGQYDSAITAYTAALQFNPDHPWALSLYYRVAKSYYQQRAYNDAINTINQMLDEDQIVNDYQVYDVLGNAYFALGRYEKAVQAYQIALQIAPPNADSVRQIKSYYQLASERI